MKSGIMESRGNHRRHGKAKIEDFRSFFPMLSIPSMGFHDSNGVVRWKKGDDAGTALQHGRLLVLIGVLIRFLEIRTEPE